MLLFCFGLADKKLPCLTVEMLHKAMDTLSKFFDSSGADYFGKAVPAQQSCRSIYVGI